MGEQASQVDRTVEIIHDALVEWGGIKREAIEVGLKRAGLVGYEHLRITLEEIRLYAEARASAAEYDESEDSTYGDAWADFIHFGELADKALRFTGATE